MKKTIFSLPILFLLAIGGAHGDTRSSVGVGFAMLSSEEDGINNIGLVYAYQQNNLVIDIGVFGGGSDAESRPYGRGGWEDSNAQRCG